MIKIYALRHKHKGELLYETPFGQLVAFAGDDRLKPKMFESERVADDYLFGHTISDGSLKTYHEYDPKDLEVVEGGVWFK